MPGRHNSSSIEGGIFGENSVRATPLPKAHASYSSIEGGIFGEPAARPITPRESITKSSIEGGVFGGQPAEAENMIPTARAKCSMDAPSKEHVAGFKAKEAPYFEERPQSARSDPNRSSVQGGIFGAQPGEPIGEDGRDRATSYARSDPNRSSIKGGIFG